MALAGQVQWPTTWMAFVGLIVALRPWVAHANCFNPDATDRNEQFGTDDQYTPCDANSGGASMCCSTTRGGDRCQSVNSQAASLCWNQEQNNLWRESCTDPSWKSAFCVKLFTNVSEDVTVTNCSQYPGMGSGYCFGTGNLGCCASGMAVFIDPVTGEQVSTDPSKQTATSNSSSSPTANSTPSDVSSNPSGGLSEGAKAGIGVGAGIVAVAIVAACFILVGRRRRRYQKAPTHLDPDIDEQFNKNAAGYYEPYQGGTKPELATHASNITPIPPTELSSSAQPRQTSQAKPAELSG